MVIKEDKYLLLNFLWDGKITCDAIEEKARMSFGWKTDLLVVLAVDESQQHPLPKEQLIGTYISVGIRIVIQVSNQIFTLTHNYWP